MIPQPLTDPGTWPDWAAPTAGITTVTVLAALAWLAGHRTRPRPDAAGEAAGPGATGASLRRWRATSTFLTVVAAAIATATAVNGMWHVFGDALGLDGPARVVLVGFLEIALMTSAIRSRVAILEHRPAGGDAAAVWVLALASAGLSAADADTPLARALRFIVPLVAAWMWDRTLAADRRRAHQTRGDQPQTDTESIAWRWTPRRLAVAAGLADPTRRESTDIDHARRLARLTRARIRLAVLTQPLPRGLNTLTLRPIRRAIAAARLQRHALGAVEHLHLGTDPTITATITTTVAAVVGLAEATEPGILRATATNPWRVPAVPATRRTPAIAASVAPAEGSSPDRPHLSHDPVGPVPTDQQLPESTWVDPADAPTSGRSAHVPPLDPVRPSGRASGAEHPATPPRVRVTAPDAAAVSRADDTAIVDAICAAGRVPSIRALQRQHALGRPRATRLAAAAAERLAARSPSGPPPPEGRHLSAPIDPVSHGAHPLPFNGFQLTSAPPPGRPASPTVHGSPSPEPRRNGHQPAEHQPPEHETPAEKGDTGKQPT